MYFQCLIRSETGLTNGLASDWMELFLFGDDCAGRQVRLVVIVEKPVICVSGTACQIDT